jgi:hypothetical protein
MPPDASEQARELDIKNIDGNLRGAESGDDAAKLALSQSIGDLLFQDRGNADQARRDIAQAGLGAGVRASIEPDGSINFGDPKKPEYHIDAATVQSSINAAEKKWNQTPSDSGKEASQPAIPAPAAPAQHVR